MSKFTCPVCGYEHKGDNLPEKCPVCKIPANKFVEEIDVSTNIISQESSVQNTTINKNNIPHYVVLQVTLKERFIGTGSKNLSELEEVINNQAAKGYRLHTLSTASAESTGFAGGDRIQATLVFEKI